MKKTTKKKTVSDTASVKSYEALEASLPIQKIQRSVATFAAQQYLCPDSFGLSMERVYDAVGENLVMQLKARIATKKFDYKKVSFPAGAWQAIKFSLKNSAFGASKPVLWFLKKYPIKMTEIEMEANAYHPDIAIPDRQTFVEILIRSRERYY